MAYGVNAPFGLRPISSISGGSWTEKVNEYYIYASADGLTTYSTNIFKYDPVVWGTSLGTANPPTLATLGGINTIARYNPTFGNAAPSTFSAVPILGVFMGCEYQTRVNGTNNLVKSPYWPGGAQVIPGTFIKAYVLDDPDVVYDIQVSTHINANGNAFVGNPIFPNTNATGATPFIYTGPFGRNFALNVGGGTNFNTVNNAAGTNAGYANNPADGNTITGISGFYLDVDTSTAAGYDNHDYDKTVITLPLRALGWTLDTRNRAAPGLTMTTTPFLNVRVTINNHVYGSKTAAPIYVA